DDCLVLNVWSAVGSADAPVLVWLHGYVATGSGSGWSEGEALARTCGVVVVTVNYRLSIFGHAADAEIPNVGLLDVVTALHWVSENIAAFGGDARNVTLGGVSAGAFRAACVATSNRSKGLVSRLVLHSPLAVRPLTKCEAEERSAALQQHLGRDPRRDVPAMDIARAAARAGPFLPVLDDDLVVDHPMEELADGTTSRLPVVVGITRDEGFAFVTRVLDGSPLTDADVNAQCEDALGPAGLEILQRYRALHPGSPPSEIASELIAGVLFRRAAFRFLERRLDAQASGAGVVHAYEFAAATNFVDRRPRTPHGFDVPFMFGNLAKVSIARGIPANRELSATMGKRWSAFMRGQGPVDRAGPEWPAYGPEREWLTLGPEPVPSIVSDPRLVERAMLIDGGDFNVASLVL
ncbi:MAG: carboxylesterase family protein, partial [Acidimicrobiia bacterium]